MKHKLEEIIKTIAEHQEKINTEEATKHYLILPFLSVLGYEVFNPNDIVPEVLCDFTKKGDRIDYVLYHGNKPSMLLECKSLGTNLNHHIGQLAKYFTTSTAKVAILTDGRHYWFFSDLEKTNLMDKSPFLKIDLCTASDNVIEKLNLFSKQNFDEIKIEDLASSLFYSELIDNALVDFFNYPPDKWIKMLCEKELKEALNVKGFSFFRRLIKDNIKDAALNFNRPEDKESADYSKGDFTSEEKEILDILNSFVIPIEELNGKFHYSKLSNGMIRINYENQYWNICRIKWGPESKYILLCKNSLASENTKYTLKSLEDLVNLKDKIIETSLATRLHCINWREKHS